MKEYITRTGKVLYFLNPSEKAEKYAKELKNGHKYINRDFNIPKVDKYGEVYILNDKQRAFRAGFLQARRDSSIAWCKKNGVPSKAVQNSKKYWKTYKASQLSK